jgi:cytochrome c553
VLNENKSVAARRDGAWSRLEKEDAMKTRYLACLGALICGGFVSSPMYSATPTEVATAEYDEIMALKPNLEDGREAYLICAVCHRPEGWGEIDGAYPQIAGQLRTVIIKQLADIRARNRDNPVMYPFSMPSTLGSTQQVADVAAYVSQLPMTNNNGIGPGNDLGLGKKLYEDNCVKCHGKKGEGSSKDHVPAIAGQHFNYLMRQFDLIRTNRRKNADPKMGKQIDGFSPREEAAVLDYTSRLRPPPEKLAEDGWTNPDFPSYVRGPIVEGPPLPEIAPMPEPPAIPEAPPMPTMPEPPAMPAPPSPPPMPGQSQ